MPQKLIEQFKLRSRLRFDFDRGDIWLDENRMLLFHAQAMGALRRELLDTLGSQRASGLLGRMGFACGQQDADLARKLLGSGDAFDVFRLGPELHAFEGQVKASIERAEFDWERGRFEGEVVWENSWEAASHLKQFGSTDHCVCWTLVGYASGYTSRFLNRLIVFQEMACVARGDPQCRIVGRPATEWDDPSVHAYLEPDNLGQQLDELREELQRIQRSLQAAQEPGKLIGTSPGFKSAFEQVCRAADTPITVLLLGETGVGKEVFARWIHANSRRAAQPFVAVNCGAIPHDLIEAELFGVCKGAYTGAQSSRPGRFERASGGTLFLDEVGDLTPSAQVKLLRALQTGEIERLGDDAVRQVDVRVVAATNVDLQRAIADGRFRADLYYRLAHYPVVIPPLRDRRSDIPLLAAAMVERYAAAYHKQLRGVSDNALKRLIDYAWPGNVRELQNLIERGVLLAPQGGCVEAEHLFIGAQQAQGEQLDAVGHLHGPGETDARRTCEALLSDGFDLDRHEAQLLSLAVERSHGNLTHAARLLGITRRQLAYRLRVQGLR